MLSFQASSHSKSWLVNLKRVGESNKDDQRHFTRAELFAIKTNYVNVLQALGRRLRLRQTVIATAIVYFWRFCLNHSFCSEQQDRPDCHPDWMAPTCLSLACKVEECPLPDVAVLASALSAIAKDPTLHFGISVDPTFMSRIMANEFVLLQALNSELLVFHPYQDLLAFVADFADHASTPLDNEQIGSLTLLAWNIINDSFRCEACLLFSPYDLALAALFMATEKRQLQGETGWWVQLQHNLTPVKHALSFVLKNA
jgi:cyclin C